jgi:hypothetical protein
MRNAVAIVILQSAPFRIANLAGRRLDRHLVRPGGPKSLWQIDIPPHEVKNDQHLVHELPRRATALVDRYIRRFRPSLAASATLIYSWLDRKTNARTGCRSRFGQCWQTGSAST